MAIYALLLLRVLHSMLQYITQSQRITLSLQQLVYGNQQLIHQFAAAYTLPNPCIVCMFPRMCIEPVGRKNAVAAAQAMGGQETL